jgi:hypothetical protein
MPRSGFLLLLKYLLYAFFTVIAGRETDQKRVSFLFLIQYLFSGEPFTENDVARKEGMPLLFLTVQMKNRE